MGKFSKGILGGFSGKVGNVVGASWKGIDVMKVKPSHVANPKTQGQLDQRTKFGLVMSFLSPMAGFLKTGYKMYAKKMTEFNAAMSYHLHNAITGSYPNYSIDFTKVLVSRGSLTQALNPSASSSTAGSLELTWTDNSGSGSALSSDIALVMVYNPSRKEVVYITDGAERYTATTSITVPADYSGEDVEVFLGFSTADGTKVSNSSYLGTVTLA